MKKPFQRGVALLSALLMGVGMAAFPAAKPLETDAAAAKTVKIACVGASTTAGAFANTSYPAELQKIAGGLVEVRNYGENSRTVMRGGIETYAPGQDMDYRKCGSYSSSLDFRPDYVLLMLGGNDAKPENWKDGNNTFVEDYIDLVQTYQKVGAEVIVVIETWFNTKPTDGISEESMEKNIRPAYRKIAEDMGLKTIDLYTPTVNHPELYLDGVHPTDAGHKFVAEIIADKLDEFGVIPEGSRNTPVPFRPDTNMGEFYGEFDGYDVMQWKGKTGYFQFTNGALATKMGINKKTVVKNLTINVSYYWDAAGQSGGNDWWHFNTIDKDGQSAPSADGGNLHDSGFGTFSQYGMVRREWQTLTVSRDNQTLGGSLDWSVNVGSLEGNNALYIRGYEVIATLSNGTLKTYHWGTMTERRGADDGKTLKIACVGASTVYGKQVPSDYGTSFPAYLQMILGNTCEVKNFGYPGARVINGYTWSYMESEQDQWKNQYPDSLAYQADVVIIDICGNDADRSFFTKERFSADYDKLVSSYREQGNDPLILIANGTYIVTPGEGAKDKMLADEVIPQVVAVANKYDIPVFNLREMIKTDPETYICKEDGVHYTAAGYKKEAQEIAAMLRPMVSIPEGENTNTDAMLDPVERSVPIGEYEGYRCLMWENGATGGFDYNCGALAFALDIDAGAVVKNLSIEVSYYWDAAGASGGNDWWHFNTTDKDGLSAPSASGDNPHDNGFGQFQQYGMKRRQWSTFTVSRDEQMLGGSGTDWSVNVGSLESKNSLYIRGYQVTATLDDGTQKVANWGVYAITVDKTALNAAIADEVADLTPYTKASADAYTAALTTAKTVVADENATQEQVDAATTALTDAKAALAAAADKTALKAAIADEVTDLSAYTQESADAYTAALNAAKAADADENATQETVDAATTALITAKAALTTSTLLGDVNEDGKVDSGDALQLLRYAAEIITDNDLNLDAADLNGDGKVDSGDALLSLQYAAEIITEFPAGK